MEIAGTITTASDIGKPIWDSTIRMHFDREVDKAILSEIAPPSMPEDSTSALATILNESSPCLATTALNLDSPRSKDTFIPSIGFMLPFSVFSL